jgi:hypothetical protein
MTKLVAILCAALLTLTACGSSDDDTAKENIKASIKKQGSSLAGGTKVTDDQAQCVADGLVDDLGVDKLQKYKLLDDNLEVNNDANPTDMTSDDAQTLAKTVVGCVDFKKIFEEQLAGSGTQLTDDQKNCVSDAIDEDTLTDVLAQGFQGKDPQMPSDMQGDLMKCMTPSQ